jgi:hypothetical protein
VLGDGGLAEAERISRTGEVEVPGDNQERPDVF